MGDSLHWVQPPVIVSLSDDLEDLLMAPMRDPRTLDERPLWGGLARSKAEARRLVGQRSARVLHEPPKILASPPVPPPDHPRHRFWIQVGKQRCARVFSP